MCSNGSYIKAPKDPVNNDDKEQKAIERKHKAEESAFGTYASKGGEQFVYRVKKEGAFGGYKIMKESTNSTLSREELLDMRKKKKSDRFNFIFLRKYFLLKRFIKIVIFFTVAGFAIRL